MPTFKDDFWTENGRNLRKPDLECLRQDHYRYKSLLMQVKGEVANDSDGIRFVNSTLAESKFKKFIGKAIEFEIDLAITPEYSCPWSCIKDFIDEGKLPTANKLWILGCQSIKPRELHQIITKRNNIVWIYDEQLVNRRLDENKFFDPACIIFKTENSEGEIKTVIIVQFKTQSFGGNEHEWELNNLIPGNTYYVIDNRIASTKLITLICSDTLEVIDFTSVKEGYFLNSPLLLIHIQINQKPFDNNYKLYRNLIYVKGNEEDYNKEIICLNWARGVTYNKDGETKTFNKYGGSALYCKTNKLDTSPGMLNHNHYSGLYYAKWTSMRTHISFLNYDEYIFYIDNTKPSMLASVASQGDRTGPRVAKTLIWDSDWVETNNLENDFSKACTEIEDAKGNLACLKDNKDVLEVERIIQLSSGEFYPRQNWHTISNLQSFHVSDSEINNRNTFAQDPDASAYDKRRKRLLRYHILKNTILTKPSNLPGHFIGVNLELDNTDTEKNHYLINIQSKATGRKGTAIYLGDQDGIKAADIRRKVASLFKENHKGKDVIVWYSSPDLERSYNEDDKPQVREKLSKSQLSYKRIKE